ncbi:MAG: helix-hairpin-helix domain-containing protein, partial [Planctomycetes bacterium]|nr:helix-hairpin-helix domain-containing protein [Planctomycetota bacterium]
MPHRRLVALPLLSLLAFAALHALAAAQPAEEATPPAPADDLTKAPAEVVIKRELKVYEQVFQRRLAMHFLRDDAAARDALLADLDPSSASSIRQLAADESSFRNLDYHFVEKRRNCEQRVLARLRTDGFEGIEDLLEVVKDKKFPESAAFADLLNIVEMNFRYALRKGLISDAEFAKDAAARFTSETVRVNGTAGHALGELAREMWKDKKGEDFPVWWFDPSSGPISYEFGAVPEAPGWPLVDLNSASLEDLGGIPNVESEIAEAIVKYAQKDGFQGPEELRLVKEVPAHLVLPLKTLTLASHAAKRKRWTVMVYLDAANNLEPMGIKDLNEMEKVGSTRDVNIVVEMVRYQGREEKPRVNDAYFHNPYTEREREFYIGLSNEPGTERYYVLKDDDMTLVQSVLKNNAGETDAGRPEHLTNFGRWAVEHYPADHYALVIWDHGAGWTGVSYDDNTRHGLDLPDVRTALEGITAALAPDGKQRIDILDFDACLMATLEVAYELKDTVDFLLASQESEPGDGMPYDDYLEWLVTYPEAPPVSFAKAMVDRYVRSYAPRGSQAFGDWSGFGETKSALRLAKAGEMKTAVEEVAALLLKREDLLGAATEEVLGDARRFGRLVDIQDFFTKLAEREKADLELKAAVEKANDLIGYPTTSYKLVNEVIIKRRSPGSVIWGYNGWQSPGRGAAPYVHRSRFAKTPLTGPDERGNYVAHITFPPMLANPKTGQAEAVKEINYRFEDETEKRTIKDFENVFVTTDFPGDGLVVAEGHMVSNNRSHGISLYFPAYLGFDKEYLKLRFAADSNWTRLCEKFPLKKIEEPKEVALLGVHHATKKDRDALGAVDVREEFRKRVRTHDFSLLLRQDLEKLGIACDVVPDPQPYGEDWPGMIRLWQDGVVIADNHAGISPGGINPYSYLSSSYSRGPSISGPDGRTLLRYLRSGGRLLLGCPDAAARIWDTPLYRDTLGLEYGMRWNRSLRFRVLGERGQDGPVLEIEPAYKGGSIVTFTGGPDVRPLCVLEESGQMIGARIERTDAETGATYRAVVLGFYLADVKGDEERLALLKEAMAFLRPAESP